MLFTRLTLPVVFAKNSLEMGAVRAAEIALLDILLDPKLFFVEGKHGLCWGTRNAKHHLRLSDASSLRVWFQRDPLLGFGLAYINGLLEVVSDTLELLDTMNAMRHTLKLSSADKILVASLLQALPQVELESERYAFQSKKEIHTIERDKEAVSYHYNLPIDFWKLVLSTDLLYTTGYYIDGQDDIDTATTAKFAMACHKLQIKDGEQVLDVGCGWGGFLIYAAQKYPNASFYGVTIAEEQAKFANEKIRNLGLKNCRIDYKHMMEIEENTCFDKITAFQSTEHMQDDELLKFFAKMNRILKSHGILFVEFMNCKLNMKRATHKFMDSYIFPDGWQFPLVTGLSLAEKAGFELFGIESCHRDYERTIQAWNDNFDDNFVACAASIDNIYRTKAMRLYFYWALWVAKSKRLKVHYCLWQKPEQEYWGMKQDFQKLKQKE